MTSELDRLEKAEAELLGQIRVKRTEYESLDHECLKLEKTVEQIERDIAVGFLEKAKGSKDLSFELRMFDVDLEEMRRESYRTTGQFKDLWETSHGLKEKWEKQLEAVKTLIAETERKIGETQLERRRSELAAQDNARTLLKGELEALQDKYNHYFGSRGRLDDLD
jgi:chromosome segregation ATPase